MRATVGFFGKVFGKKEDDFGASDDIFKSAPLDPMKNDDPFAHHDPLAPGSDPHAPNAFAGQEMPHLSTPQYPGGSPVPGTAGYRQTPGGYPAQQPYPQQQFPQAQQVPPGQYGDYDESRDVELILAKLDAIKAELDSVHQRVRKLEQFVDAQQSPGSSAQKKYAW